MRKYFSISNEKFIWEELEKRLFIAKINKKMNFCLEVEFHVSNRNFVFQEIFKR
jgi:hypothetical protein